MIERNMITAEKRRQIHRLLDLALDLNESGGKTMFFEFSGHTCQVDISAYENAWYFEKEPLYKQTCYMDMEMCEETLPEMIEKLQELREEKNEAV